MVAKMGGLQVDIHNYVNYIYNQSSWVNDALQLPPVNTPTPSLVFTVGAPADIVALVSTLGITNDGKVYLRQSKRDLFMKNVGPPGFMRLTYFKVRKNIDTTDYTDWYSLLSSDSIPNSSWGTPQTLSANAQRMLKWTKSKMITMGNGAVKHIKLNAKFTKPVSLDVEANTNFLATPITRGVIMKWIPAPRGLWSFPASSSTPGIPTYQVPDPYCVLVMGQRYTSAYEIGKNDPTVSYTAVDAEEGYPGHLNIPGYTFSAYHIPQNGV